VRPSPAKVLDDENLLINHDLSPPRFFLNSAYLYERLVRTYSVPPSALVRARAQHPGPAACDETTELLSQEALQHLDDAEDEFVAMEVHLQLSLIKVRLAASGSPRCFLT
jgi:hypothetical protein